MVDHHPVPRPATPAHHAQAQEAQGDEYIRSLEAGAGVMPMPPALDVLPTPTPTPDDDTLRLTAAVEAGLKQASQRVAVSAALPEAPQTAAQPTADDAPPPTTDAAAAASYPATLDRPAPQATSANYVVVSDTAAVEGSTVVQQVQSIAAAGVAQSRSAVRQLQEQLDRRQG